MYTIKNFNYIQMKFIQLKLLMLTLFTFQNLDLALRGGVYLLAQLVNMQD